MTGGVLDLRLLHWLEEGFLSFCFSICCYFKMSKQKQNPQRIFSSNVWGSSKDYFHMLYILLILIALKFIMYNKCKCSSCQGSSISQFLETNYQDLYLDTVTHWLYYHCGQIFSLLNLLNHIMLMTMVMINNLPHWVLLVLNVKTCNWV